MEKKYNLMFDVAFTIEGPWEDPSLVPPNQLLVGMAKRLHYLMSCQAEKSEDVTEAFGFCDSYEVDQSFDPSLQS